MKQERRGFINPSPIRIPSFDPKLELAVLASGKGSNFERILMDIKDNKLDAIIKCLIVNRSDCGAINIAKKYSIPYFIHDHKNYSNRELFDLTILNTLKEYKVEAIIMVGWMRIVTSVLLNEFKGRVVNIHPSLLPSFKGNKAISQTIKSKVKITGCTVHLVDQEIDSGQIIIQAAVPVLAEDTEVSLLSSVQYFEHKIISLGIGLAAEKWRNS